MTRAILLASLLVACSSSPAPRTAPPGSSGSAVSGAGASGSAAHTACPSDDATLIGKPCTTENATCGGPATPTSPGFSNAVVCQGGTWTQVEIPPPGP